MRGHTVNYRERDGASGADGDTLLSRGFWLHGVPRPLLLCRLLGHRAVVDGTAGSETRPGYRWVVCDRCGARPEPQGVLDAARWRVGQRYDGPWGELPPVDPDERFAWYKRAGCYPPGPWPTRSTGVLGGQLVLGVRHPVLGFGLKVGSAGSEQTLALHVHLLWLGDLYLHTERFGDGLRRRLNPTGYESKVVSVDAQSGRLYWRFWRDRNSGRDSKAPWRVRVRDGSVTIDPRTLLLGPRRYSYTDIGEPVKATIRLAHGDEHEVVLVLRQQSLGRKRGRKKLSFSVECDAGGGLPTQPDNRDRVCGLSVPVSDAAVAVGTWPMVAEAAIAARVHRMRAANDWLPQPA